MRIETDRLVLTLPPPAAAADVLAYFTRNREHLAPWDPPRPASFHTEAYWRSRLEQNRREYSAGRSMRLLVLPRGRERIVGTCNFTGFERGAFLNCRLGYTIDAELEGGGFMAEALTAAIGHVFTELGFHRIEANYRPSNERSGRLLRRLGFEIVGFARDYLFIDGAWRDHVLTALIAPTVATPDE
ncbi:MAG: GNAT family N-acetyltransferase [Planctomycetota bacterium]